MIIDLRWLLPVVAFYAPGALMLIGAWALGYTTEEAREVVFLLGVIVGCLFTGFLMPAIFDLPPLRVRIWGKGDE